MMTGEIGFKINTARQRGINAHRHSCWFSGYNVGASVLLFVVSAHYGNERDLVHLNIKIFNL